MSWMSTALNLPSPLGVALIALIALIAIFGLIVGSFCNVVVWRLPQMLLQEDTQGLSAKRVNLMWPRSHCPHCLHPLRPQHLVPVLSFMWLKGQCADCAQKISPRYWATELLVSLWWMFCAVKFQLLDLSAHDSLTQHLFLTQWTSAFLWALMGSALICLAQIDWEHQLLPDAITQPFLWLGLLSAQFGLLGLTPKASLLGAAMGYMSLWIIAKIYFLLSSRDGLGQGDMKLLALFGAWMGPLSLIALVLLASSTGAVFGLWRLKVKKDLDLHEPIAFGPFLILAAFTLLLLGPEQVLAFFGLKT